MHRFYLPQKLDKDLLIIKEKTLIHQISRVLKLHKGELVIFFSTSVEEGGIDTICELKNIQSGSAMFLVRDRIENMRESKKKLTLYCSLIKKEKFECILQKCTEVGVTEFVPVLATRSEKKNINFDRCQYILKEAAEQSGRAIIPKLHLVTSLDKALEKARASGTKNYFADTKEHDNVIRGAGDRSIGLFIGPEGGWDDKELFAAMRANCEIVSLGRLTLRAETAAIAGSFMLLWG
ncbi:MAG: RsmE family RNA methyltransferase [Patescibacteria group bacterium]